MSRQAQLPPRFPLQKRSQVRQADDIPTSQPSCMDTVFNPRQCGHHISISQSSILQGQPAWLDDLLSDSESSYKVASHRRSASDSLALLGGLATFPDLDQCNEVETTDSCVHDAGFASGCAYGPNSPRRKNMLDFPEKEIVSAISEYALRNPMQHLDGCDIPVSSVPQSSSIGDACDLAGEIDAGGKPMKRHPGQRSRARKLQYIAELERTVDLLQNLGSELTVRIASQIQQHTALLMENDTLKQRLQRMQQEKFILDGEYLSLKKEAEKLRAGLAVPSSNKFYVTLPAVARLAPSDAAWKTLDMQKLNLK